MKRLIKCTQCKGELTNNEIALNFKLFGKQIGMLLCYECLSYRLDCKKETLEIKANNLKQSGCALFSIDYVKESSDVSN